MFCCAPCFVARRDLLRAVFESRDFAWIGNIGSSVISLDIGTIYLRLLVIVIMM